MAQEKVPPHTSLHNTNWHAEHSLSALGILRSRESGLTDTEVLYRMSIHGPNALPNIKPPGFFRRVVDQLKSPLTLVLVGAFLVTFSFQEFVDAGVIALALLIAVVVGLIQEGKASAAFVKLSESQEHIAQVHRNDNKKYQIDARELVPGDIVQLQSGMQVPADVRLLQTKDFSVNEAALTGEWLAVKKQLAVVAVGTPLSERSNMAYKGTYVATGTALAVVVATGTHTVLGSLAQELSTIEGAETPLQREVRKISQYMLYFILGLIGVLFVIGILQGQSVHDMLLISIAIAVASVPEGLPAALTIILAVGMESLLKRGGLVKNLLAAETLGSTTYVLTDKTGTLTEGRMSISAILQGDAILTFSESTDVEVLTQDLIRTALYASDAFYDEKAGLMRGDPVEVAVLQLAEEIGLLEGTTDWQKARTDYLPFSSELRYAAGLVYEQGRYRLCINGAPGILLGASSEYVGADGVVATLNPQAEQQLRQQIDEHTKQGSRLIAVAYKDVMYHDLPNDTDILLSDLVFAGVLVLTDPVRKDVKDAICGVERAGARILLVTGDNPQTALTVANLAGISITNQRALIGTEIEQLSDEELLHAIDAGVSVFARVLPQQKLRITQLLQQRGEIVAMTGDGINDSLALQRANIGVAVGSGTEVAKEAADLVLVNDTFATIHSAIEEGRRIVSNLRKVIGYLLSTSLSEVVLIGTALLSGAASPLTAIQILWANVIEEGFMSIAFAFEKGDKNLMQEKPRDIHKDGILSRQMLFFTLFTVVSLALLNLGLYFYLRFIDVPFSELQSVMFLAVAVDSMFMAFAFRSLTKPLWQIPLKTNLFFLGALTLNASLLILVLSVPTLRGFLSYEPLPFYDILLVVGLSLASLLTVEIGKWLFFARRS